MFDVNISRFSDIGTMHVREPLCRFEFDFRSVEPVTLPSVAGSAWRGAFGAALKRFADAVEPAPHECGQSQAAGLFATLFEDRQPPRIGFDWPSGDVPRPFAVLVDGGNAARRLAPGETSTVAVTLVGWVNTALPVLVAAFARAAENGIGRGRGRLALEQVTQVWRSDQHEGLVLYRPGEAVRCADTTTPIIPPMPRSVVVEIVSPLRLLRDGRLVMPAVFEPRDILMYAIRRISLLSRCHADQPIHADFRHLKAVAERIRMVDYDLDWFDTHRWSASQRREVAMGGIVGWFVLDMSDAEMLWPFLWLAQWVHVGRSATMGWGAISLRPA